MKKILNIFIRLFALLLIPPVAVIFLITFVFIGSDADIIIDWYKDKFERFLF